MSCKKVLPNCKINLSVKKKIDKRNIPNKGSVDAPPPPLLGQKCEN